MPGPEQERDRSGAETGHASESGQETTGSARLAPLPALKKRARVGAKQVVRRQVPGGSRHAFRVDMIAMLLAGLYTGAVFPFLPLIAREQLHASATVIAILTAAPFLGNLMALFWARAMEGKRKVPFVLWSHLGARSIVLTSVFATSALPFVFVMSACQVVGTIATPAYAAIIKDVYPDSQRGRILSFTRAAILIAQVVATLFAGWLMIFVSYRYVFPVAALIGIASALVFSRINPGEGSEPEEDEEDTVPEKAPRESLGTRIRETAGFIWGTLGILREDQAYRWFALSVFTYGFGNLMTQPIIPLIQVDELQIDTGQLAILSNVMQAAAVSAYFYWGRYVDRRSPQRAVVLNILLNCLIPVVYIATGFIPGANAWTLVPAYVLSGIVLAGIDMSYFNALLTFAGPENVSRYQALQSFLLGVRGSIAPFVGGWLVRVLRGYDHDLRWVFALGLVFMLAGAAMQLVATRRQEAMQRLLDRG